MTPIKETEARGSMEILMTDGSTIGAQKRPVAIGFWILSGAALLWNLIGLLAYFMQLAMMNSPEVLAELPEAQQELYKSQPNWVMICFTVAVVCGVLGCILLLLRKKWSIPVFALSLLGVIGQQGYNFFLSDTIKVMVKETGMAAIVLPAIVLVVAVALVFYSRSVASDGTLT